MATNKTESIELELDCLRVTDKAVLVVSDWNKKEWIALSVIDDSYHLGKHTNPWTIKFRLPVWLAKKKGLI